MRQLLQNGRVLGEVLKVTDVPGQPPRYLLRFIGLEQPLAGTTAVLRDPDADEKDTEVLVEQVHPGAGATIVTVRTK